MRRRKPQPTGLRHPGSQSLQRGPKRNPTRLPDLSQSRVRHGLVAMRSVLPTPPRAVRSDRKYRRRPGSRLPAIRARRKHRNRSRRRKAVTAHLQTSPRSTSPSSRSPRAACCLGIRRRSRRRPTNLPKHRSHRPLPVRRIRPGIKRHLPECPPAAMTFLSKPAQRRPRSAMT